MIKVKIQFFNDCLILLDSSNDFVLYETSGQQMTQLTTSGQSVLIMHLLPKIWIDTLTLYKIAKLINHEFPENQIDWRQTFYLVERKNYLESVSEILLPQIDAETESLKQMTQFGMDEANDFTDKIIMEIVANRLSEFGIY